MGWCSATVIFDDVVEFLVGDEPIDRRAVIKQLIRTLESADWDCQQDSGFWDDPLVRSVFEELHPEWFDYEEEED